MDNVGSSVPSRDGIDHLVLVRDCWLTALPSWLLQLVRRPSASSCQP